MRKGIAESIPGIGQHSCGEIGQSQFDVAGDCVKIGHPEGSVATSEFENTRRGRIVHLFEQPLVQRLPVRTESLVNRDAHLQLSVILVLRRAKILWVQHPIGHSR